MKISEGKYELNTTKQDAIDKFMQLQGICREENQRGNAIEFRCYKKGKIIIKSPPRKRVENDNATNLFAQVIEQNGKTYVSYRTSFSALINASKCIFLAVYILAAVLAIVLTVFGENRIYYLPILFLGLIFFGFKLFSAFKEKADSPKDSETLVKELEKRVEAINEWDK